MNTMKKILLSAGLLINGLIVAACPVCDRQQPELLRGITHSSGPQSNWDYLIIAVAVVIVVLTLAASVKWLVRPGETSVHHIKQLILNHEYNGQ